MQSVELECPECGAYHWGEVGEDGATLDVRPCEGSPTCTKKLCQTCRRQCGSCDLWACGEHIVDVAGRLTCHLCLAVEIAEGAELAKESA